MKFHMYLVNEDTGTIVDDVVVSASNDAQAERSAYTYFAEYGDMTGLEISNEYGYVSEGTADIRAKPSGQYESVK